jgi:hypothetical protein
MATKRSERFVQFLRDSEPGAENVPRYRLYVMRTFFVLTVLLLGRDAWAELLSHEEVWNPLEGVAYSFWAAYSTLMILGLRHPLKMVPLLMLQFFYKLVWLTSVAFPPWRGNHLDSGEGLVSIFVAGIVLDLLIIPWGYVFRTYLSRAAR